MTMSLTLIHRGTPIPRAYRPTYWNHWDPAAYRADLLTYLRKSKEGRVGQVGRLRKPLQ